MNSRPPPDRVAVTGASGFLGRSLASLLSAHFAVRLMDIQTPEGQEQSVTGDAASLKDAMSLCEGCSDLVIAHMAVNRPEIYGDPVVPFDVNVKGVANLSKLLFLSRHFSRFIQPGAHRILSAGTRDELEVLACKNPDGGIAIVILNRSELSITFALKLNNRAVRLDAPRRSIQTISVSV